MFLKAKDVDLGQANALSGKDVKKFIAAILNCFQGLNSQILEDKLGLAGKCKIFKVKLPRKVILYSLGLPSDNEYVTSFIECHNHQNKQSLPIFIDTNSRGDLFPTLVTLTLLFRNENTRNQVPPILRTITIHSPASKYIINGADVMLPGIVRYKEDFNSDCFGIGPFEKGTKIVILASGNPIPFAVGKFLLSSASAIESNFQGKGVEVIHSYGDQLWHKCFKFHPNAGFDTSTVKPIDIEQNSFENDEDLSAKTSYLHLEEDQDTLLLKTFKQCIPKLKKQQFPLLASKFFATVLLPSRPLGVNIDIKQTRYKKVNVFLYKLQELGIFKLSNTEDVLRIEELICEKLDSLEGFSSSTGWKKVDEIGVQLENEKLKSENQLKPRAIKILEFYKANKGIYNTNDSLTSVFGSENSLNEFYSISECRKILFDYINRENLSVDGDGSVIFLNPVLSNLLVPREAVALKTIKKSLAWTNFLKTFSLYHQIVRVDGSISKKTKGEPKKIKIDIKRRQGNKSVTRVADLEVYGIDPSAFAIEGQTKFSCSTTTQLCPGQGNKKLAVIIQGNKVKEVIAFLESKYGINGRHISS